MARIKVVLVELKRKWNLGNYESLEAGASTWVHLSEEEDEDAIIQLAMDKCHYHLEKAYTTRERDPESPYLFNVSLSEDDLRSDEEESFEEWRRKE